MTPPPRSRSRIGATLVELLVALTLCGMVAAAAASTMHRQLRSSALLASSLNTHATLAQSGAMLALELRALSHRPEPSGILSDSAVGGLFAIGGSVVCRAIGGRVELAPSDENESMPLTFWSTTPDSGDVAFVNVSDSTSNGWQRMEITAVRSLPANAACPPSTIFGAGSTARRMVLTHSSAALDSLAPSLEGAPVRVMRAGRYTLYRAADREWWLGYRRCSASSGGCGAVQPIAGPLGTYSAERDESGLRFYYYDGDGVEILAPLGDPALARIDIHLRAPRDRRMASGDSLVVRVALRN